MMTKKNVIGIITNPIAIFSALVLVCSAAQARQITVIAGWHKPPYVLAAQDSGFELDLTREILQALGHTMKVSYAPFGRTHRLLKTGVADMVITVSPNHQISSHLLTDVYVTYENTVITLAERQLSLSHPNDLKGYTVAAFQTAGNVLGMPYYSAIAGHDKYLEIADQSRQVKMLLVGSVDVAVMEKNIFNWLYNALPARFQHPVTYHPVFSPSPYRAAIRDDALRAGFNEQLQRMKQSGRYAELVQKYQLSGQ